MAEVAEALQELNEEIVFVGGAVLNLYTDDPAADEIRPTQDVDLTLSIASFNQWNALQGKLGALGFHPNPFGHAICSYKYKNILVDIMATEDGPLGPANKWYKLGFNNLWTAEAKDQEIKILSAPCFLASKFEAFNSRGKDYRSSHDIEDIIYVLDNRIDIVNEVEIEQKEVRQFLIDQLATIVNRGLLSEVLSSHIHPLMLEERLPIVEVKISQIIGQ